MRLSLRVSLIVVLVAVLLPFHVLAQTLTDTLNEAFTLYGHTHTLTRPADLSHFAYNVDAIKHAIENAVTTYDRLWHSVDPELWLELFPTIDTSAPTSVASAALGLADVPIPGSVPIRTASHNVCHIIVYNSDRVPDTDQVQFAIAHEVAHCYQVALIPLAHSVVGFPTSSAEYKLNQWWLDGSANWLALKVHAVPTGFSLFNGFRTAFVNYHTLSLIGAGDHVFAYDAMFFWEALERSIGVAPTLAFLTNMPITAEAQAAYLGHRRDVDNLFNDYGLFAAWGDLGYQPPAESLFSEIADLTTVPSTSAPITIKKFSMNPMILNIPASAQNGVSLKATGLTTSGVTVRLLSGVTLSEGVAVSVCNLTSPQIQLVASRADKGRSDQIHFSLASHPCPTTAPAITNECYYGIWRLATLPTFTGSTLSMAFSGTMDVTLKHTGAAILHYQDFSITTRSGGQTVTVVMNGTLLNSVQIASNGTTTGTTPSGLETMVANAFLNGQPAANINLGDYLRNMGGGGLPSNTRLVCSGNQLQEFVNVPAIQGPYIFERQ